MITLKGTYLQDETPIMDSMKLLSLPELASVCREAETAAEAASDPRFKLVYKSVAVCAEWAMFVKLAETSGAAFSLTPDKP
jgi:hypothetical protein